MQDPITYAIDQMNMVREALAECREKVEVIAKDAKPPVVQEIILAQRHIEDARMRLGVARTLQQGNDPWIEQNNQESK
jgi:hypothetical protein